MCHDDANGTNYNDKFISYMRHNVILTFTQMPI